MAGKTMQITDLRIYPIKSCRGISLEKSTMTRKGLQNDRRFMFIDATKDNKFITIRQKSEMTLINTSIDEATQTLYVTFPAIKEAGLKETTITVPLEPTEEYLTTSCEQIEVNIWDFVTDGYAFTDTSITTPIANYFGALDSSADSSDSNPSPKTNVRLVMKGPTPRPTGGNGSLALLGRQEHVNFPDVLPVLVATATSLRGLNSRLQSRDESPITIERFRPNIIVDSPDLQPWEEDEWRTLRFNPPTTMVSSLTTMFTPASLSSTIDVDVSARCARCHVPNVDPDTAVAHKKEPWSVLYSYRRVDEGIKFKPCFGMLCCPRSEGEVKVGMTVEVKEVMAAAGGKGEHRYAKGF